MLTRRLQVDVTSQKHAESSVKLLGDITSAMCRLINSCSSKFVHKLVTHRRCAARQQALAVIDALTDLGPRATLNLGNGMVFQELQQSEQVYQMWILQPAGCV